MDKKKAPVIILSALLVVAVGVIIFLVAGNNKQESEAAQTVNVPDVVKVEQHDAEKLIISAGLTVGKVDEANSDDVAAGHVISQDPAAGTKVDQNTSVNIVVSSGKAKSDKTTVPDLMGKSHEEAEKALKDAKLIAVPGNPVYSDEVEPGKVCSQSVAAGTQVDEGSQVVFSTSLGKETVAVPDVTGKPVAEARSLLNKAGLGTDTTTAYSDKVAKDSVISQSVPKDTKVVKGTIVTLQVSLGARPKTKVKVPNIYTYTLEDAKKALDSAGLKYRYSGDNDGTVVDVDPEPGTEVDQGSTVTFTLQHHASLVAVPNVAGMSGTDAGAELEQVGLVLDYDKDQPDRTLSSTDPVAGTMVDVNSTVKAVYEDAPTPEPGAWETNTKATSHVSKDEKAIFSQAVASLSAEADDSGTGDSSDSDSVPVAVIATQVASGTNYAFLGYSDDAWTVFNISTDTDGNAKLVGTKTISVANVKTTDKGLSGTAGAWTASDAEAGTLSPKTVADAFAAAQANYTGVSVKPIALLGQQVTSGTTYKILCTGTPSKKDAQKQLYVVTLQDDANGTSSFSDVSLFDLVSYL